VVLAHVPVRPTPGCKAAHRDYILDLDAELTVPRDTRHVIFNPDDFGLTSGVNRGILESHVRGVVTSTSLMVWPPGASEAAAMARDWPGLSVGLHFDFEGHPADLSALRGELARQLEDFERLVGLAPTHVDSHHHLHCSSGLPLSKTGWGRGEMCCSARR
jgi:predicted glycoside hydrolase/deacetylase ChbG (UPF0249 family)